MTRPDLTGTVLGSLRLTHKLGEGGMATVYAAENTLQPSIRRAVKVVHPELASRSGFIERFLQEAAVLEGLQHPAIVRFYGLQQLDGHTIMELELLEGEALDERIDAGERVSAVELLEWARDIAEGLGAAHAAGVIHRDIKPANLFRTAEGRAKVLDFGIARAAEPDPEARKLTGEGTVPGTAAYLAPEVWETGQATAAADIYALGLSLIELATGRHPFAEPDGSHPSLPQLMRRHLIGELPSLATERPDLSPVLLAAIQAACELEPDDRPADGSAFLAVLASSPQSSAPTQPKSRRSATTLSLPTVGDAGAQPPAAPTGGTRLNLPTVPKGPTGAEAAPARKPMSKAVLFGGGGVLMAGLAAGGLWMFWPKPPPPSKTVTPASLVKPNPWVDLTPPERPVLLGVGEVGGVGFLPDAGVRSPLSAYAIQQHEVTWSELDPFLKASGASFELPAHVPEQRSTRKNLPVSGVPWEVAAAYCESLGDGARLPTEEEWEFAARGPQLRAFSWGDSPADPARTNLFAGSEWEVAPVMSHKQDRTPGEAPIWDLMGNVREWAADPFRISHNGVTPAAAANEKQTLRVIRGLPLKPQYTGEEYTRPRIGAAWRAPLCGSGTCLSEPTIDGEPMQEALSEVGFRCARAL